jgi:hypothetical protein
MQSLPAELSPVQPSSRSPRSVDSPSPAGVHMPYRKMAHAVGPPFIEAFEGRRRRRTFFPVIRTVTPRGSGGTFCKLAPRVPAGLFFRATRNTTRLIAVLGLSVGRSGAPVAFLRRGLGDQRGEHHHQNDHHQHESRRNRCHRMVANDLEYFRVPVRPLPPNVVREFDRVFKLWIAARSAACDFAAAALRS